MINDIKAEKITKFLVTCALLFSCLILFTANFKSSGNTGTNFPYSDTLFNEDKVSDIQISIDENDWAAMLENPLDETYYSCSITINGESLYNVGIRTKGNTSLSQVASSDSDRYSFKVKFDKYVSGQTYNGLDMLNLNNIYSDATYLKEYLSYDLFNYIGVTTPECAFSKITINNETQGLYLAIEGLQNSYLERNYGTDSGNLYKAEGTGTNLIYNGEEQSNYSGLKDNSVKDITDEDFQKVIDMIRNLNEGTNLEDYIDIDSTLKYFAVSTALVNLDSYQCNLYHNYYIYEKDGVCTILPWDLNLSFGGFSGGGGGNNNPAQNNYNKISESYNSTSALICFPIDEPTSASMDNSPLLSKLLTVDEYKEIYHNYLQQIVNEYFNSGIFKTKLYTSATLIDSYVKEDPTAFYDYTQFTESIDELYNFGKYRAESIALQLSGEMPSTKSEQSNVDLTQYFSNDLVDMNILGSMGGSKGDTIPDNNYDNIQGTFDNKTLPDMPAKGNENIPSMNPGNSTPPSPDNNKVQQFNSPNRIPNSAEPNSTMSNDTFNEASPNDKKVMEEKQNTPNIQNNNEEKLNPKTDVNVSIYSIITLLVCFIVIVVSIIFTMKFKRKKYTV